MMSKSNGKVDKQISCQQLEAFIDDYLDENLSEIELTTFNAHLEMCPMCDKYLDNYRNSVALGKAAYKNEDECESIPEPLVQAILAASKKDTK